MLTGRTFWRVYFAGVIFVSTAVLILLIAALIIRLPNGTLKSPSDYSTLFSSLCTAFFIPVVGWTVILFGFCGMGDDMICTPSNRTSGSTTSKAKESFICNRVGRQVGIVRTEPDGTKLLMSFNGGCLGWYRPKENMTTTFGGQWISQGDTLAGILYEKGLLP